MKKLILILLTFAGFLLGSNELILFASAENGTESTAASNETEIVMVSVESDNVGNALYTYTGYFLTDDGMIREFSFSDVSDCWTFHAAWNYFYNAPDTVTLNEPLPHAQLVSKLSETISEYDIIGYITEAECNDKISALSGVDIETEIPYQGWATADDIKITFTELFGVRYNDTNGSEVVFLNGHISGEMYSSGIYLRNPDESAVALSEWFVNIRDFMEIYDTDAETPTTTTTQDDSSTVTTTETNEVPIATEVSATTTETTAETTTTTVTTDSGTTSATTVSETTPKETESSATTAGTASSTETAASATDTEPIATATTGVPVSTETETALPQTGYSKWYQLLIAAAVGMIGIGGTVMIKSGVLIRKR